jgi:hypothetical protein
MDYPNICFTFASIFLVFWVLFLLGFLFVLVFLFFVFVQCLIPNVGRLSRLSIPDCPSGFLERDSVRCICNLANTFNRLFFIIFIILDRFSLLRNRF